VNKTTLYLPEDLRRTLKEEARRTGRPEAAIVREALAAYLRHRVRPRPRSIGAGEDLEVAARDSEAWLRDHWGRA
jgi:predicted transcriptional regulator